MKSTFIVFLLLVSSCCYPVFSQSIAHEKHGDVDGYLLTSSIKKTWSVHVTINLGFCQAAGTITYTTNDITGDIHAFYSLATTCGGTISGTGGQFFRSLERQSQWIVDPTSISYSFESAKVEKQFELYDGRCKLEYAINEGVLVE
jgi:hypothetical protein